MNYLSKVLCTERCKCGFLSMMVEKWYEFFFNNFVYGSSTTYYLNTCTYDDIHTSSAGVHYLDFCASATELQCLHVCVSTSESLLVCLWSNGYPVRWTYFICRWNWNRVEPGTNLFWPCGCCFSSFPFLLTSWFVYQ